eukprot:CCRYP_010945-RA/>CCRYP_010945-RA protein AED:0.13 eAED:0.11 QI:0/-1/0/1/-1/1/1/0/243
MHKITTSLFGTIRFKGNAKADLTASVPPRGLHGDESDITNYNRTLTSFLSSSDSDAILLGMKDGSAGGIAQVRKIETQSPASPSVLERSRGNSVTWECRQSKIEWFGMTLVPIFTNVIERSESTTHPSSGSGTVVISIIDAKTEVQNGGRLGGTLASAMKRSVFEGRYIVFWREEHGEHESMRYTLEGDIELSLTINLPPFVPLPPGFNSIGSRIVERTCRDRLRQNLRDVSDAYVDWVHEGV